MGTWFNIKCNIPSSYFLIILFWNYLSLRYNSLDSCTQLSNYLFVLKESNNKTICWCNKNSTSNYQSSFHSTNTLDSSVGVVSTYVHRQDIGTKCAMYYVKISIKFCVPNIVMKSKTLRIVPCAPLFSLSCNMFLAQTVLFRLQNLFKPEMYMLNWVLPLFAVYEDVLLLGHTMQLEICFTLKIPFWIVPTSRKSTKIVMTSARNKLRLSWSRMGYGSALVKNCDLCPKW